MRLLVTRPEPDASALAEQLATLGHEAVIAPLMDVAFHDVEINLDGVRAVLFTSANGVRAFACRNTPQPGTKVLAVGQATAQAARAQGWEDVTAADGNVVSLTALATRTLDLPSASTQGTAKSDGRLLHVSGQVAAGDLAGELREHGYDVERRIMYAAQPAETLPEMARLALQEGTLDGVLLMSPRTAGLYTDLVKKAGLRRQASKVPAYCLSASVARMVFSQLRPPVHVAAKPDIGHLLALLSA